MSQLLNLHIFVLLIPLIISFLLGFFGTGFIGKFINFKLTSFVSIFLIILSNILSYLILLDVVQGNSYEELLYTWISIDKKYLNIGFLIDPLSSIMIFLVNFISLIVNFYSMSYMKYDNSYQRFFCYISLFNFCMISLVLSNNILQLFFGWESVGLISYLLIGFWYKKDKAIIANMKAFLINKLGDVILFIGLCLMFKHIGSIQYIDIIENSKKIESILLPKTNLTLSTLISIMIFIGAMSKSAQIPLHIWLPNSMEGPTPISALIHAATMVTAGIFVIIRFANLFDNNSGILKSFIMINSIFGSLFLGLIGTVQSDIKKIIAYSTLSQLGYMTASLSISYYYASIFHLVTHAFFKSLLFLGAGSIILRMNHMQNIHIMGGLNKQMNITYITSSLGILSLVGYPFFSGFYSKEIILEIIYYSNLIISNFSYYIVIFSIFITSIYSFRYYFFVFHGINHSYKILIKNKYIRRVKNKENYNPINISLLILSIPSIYIGLQIIKTIFLNNIMNTNEIFFYSYKSFLKLPYFLIINGLVTSWYVCIINQNISKKIYKKYFLYKNLLDNKYYIDLFINKFILNFVKILGIKICRRIDLYLIDGLMIKGVSYIIIFLSNTIKHIQSGYIYHYSCFMILSMMIIILCFFLINY